ncbi:MAG: hypothetical protein AAF611_17440 [Bacteroidota bacterium]
MEFDKNVVLIPPLPDVFDRPLWEAVHTKAGYCPEWKVKKGDSIERGQILCTFKIPIIGLFNWNIDLNIYSPVNGVFLYENKIVSSSNEIHTLESYQNILKNIKSDRPGIVIAIPKDTYPQETARFAYEDFDRHYWALKIKVFRNKYSKEEIENLLDILLRAPLLRVPLSGYKSFI